MFKKKLFKKGLWIIKFTVCFQLCMLMEVSANGFAQELTIRAKKVSMEDVFKTIEKKTEHTFFYDERELQGIQKIDVNYVNTDLEDVLNDLLFKHNLEYKIVEKTILVKAPKRVAVSTNTVVSEKNRKNQTQITGRVLDINGTPLMGVSVFVVESQVGSTTDENGSYVVEGTPGQTIRYTYMGFKEHEETIGTNTTIDVVLEEDLSNLDEVVVVGMGVQRKASVVGAISSVKMDDIKIPSRSLTNALAGRMSGAVVVQRTGELGADNGGIWIRGISSFSDNRSPLILVDGVERDMQDLSAEEVESVSILKDASATAVYGVRAANGVVLVTTRKGIAQKPVIEFKSEYGASDLPDLPRFLDGPNYARLYNEALGRENYSQEYIENTASGIDPYLYPNVNWYEETYKDVSNNGQASLNVRGGGEVARYFVNFGYLNESGNLKNNPENEYKSNLNLQRYNFRSNIDVTLFKSTVVDLEVGGSLTDLHTPGLGGTIYSSTYSPAGELFRWASLATPISNPVRIPIGQDINGNDIWGWGAPTQIGEMNPVERLMASGFNTEFRNQFMSQITLNQDLSSWTEGLRFRFSYAFDAYNLTTINRRKNASTYGVQGRDPETGELLFTEVNQGDEFLGYSRNLSSNRAKELKTQVTYNNAFGDHRIGGMLMYYQRDFINGNAASAILSLPYRRQGIAFRTTYDFKDRYFAEFNIGYNGSENFPEENRFGFFPAVAAGWLVSNEPFWNDLANTVSLLKLRGSIGLVGSEALPGGQRYGYLSIYGAGLGGYVFGDLGTAYTGTGEDRIGVTNLTWEKGLKKNVGFELGLFNGLINIEADYFHETRTDILLQRASLPGIAGLNSAPFANMGEMENRGFDGTIEVMKRYDNGGIRVYGNFTYARDKIIEQDEAQKNYEYRMRTGHKYGQQFGLVSLGYFVDEEDIKNSPTQTFGDVRPGDLKFLDVNGDGIVSTDDEVPIGYSNLPEINYGFGFQVDWKGIDLGMFFRGQARVSYALGGAYIPFNQGVGKGNLFVEAMDRWTVENPNPNAQYPRLFNGTSSNNWQRSTHTIYDGSFLRLTDIEVGYTLQGAFLESIKVKRLRIYGIANNVAVFAPWKMWDPETGSPDGGNYPLQRKVNLGIRATF